MAALRKWISYRYFAENQHHSEPDRAFYSVLLLHKDGPLLDVAALTAKALVIADDHDHWLVLPRVFVEKYRPRLPQGASLSTSWNLYFVPFDGYEAVGKYFADYPHPVNLELFQERPGVPSPVRLLQTLQRTAQYVPKR